MADEQNPMRISLKIEEVRQHLSAEVLREYALQLEKRVVEAVDAMGINDTGTLRKSITHEFVKEKDNLILRVGPGIIKPFPYPVAVHEGTKPHFPPTEPLQEWVKRKLRIRSEKKLERVTRLIQWKIAKHGTKARPFLREVFEQEQGQVESDLVKIARRKFNEIV